MSAECEIHGTDLLWGKNDDGSASPNYCPSCELDKAKEEIRALHGERALAPGLECKCKWCKE